MEQHRYSPGVLLFTVALLALVGAACEVRVAGQSATAIPPTVPPTIAATVTATARPVVTPTVVTQTQPAIVVTSPRPNDTVTSPLRLQGNASVFEATVEIRLLGEGGRVLVETFVTASEGAPGRGTFSIDIPFRGIGPGVVQAFSRSQRDGSIRDLVEVPVRLNAP